MLEQIKKLLRYRTIEQGLQNCRNIGHSSKVILYFIDLKTVVYSSRSRHCRGIELSSRDFKTVAILVTRGLKTVEHIEHIEQGLENCRGIELSSRDLKTVEHIEHIEQGLENCRGIELSSRDFKTVTISVTRVKLYCINTWFACTSPSPEAQSPAGDLASAYPPKPLLFTLLGVGA